MKEIEGADLTALIDDAEALVKATKIEAAKKAIIWLRNEIDRNEGAVRNAEEQLSSAKKKLEAARARYERAKGGDWNVIPAESEMAPKKDGDRP